MRKSLFLLFLFLGCATWEKPPLRQKKTVAKKTKKPSSLPSFYFKTWKKPTQSFPLPSFCLPEKGFFQEDTFVFWRENKIYAYRPPKAPVLLKKVPVRIDALLSLSPLTFLSQGVLYWRKGKTWQKKKGVSLACLSSRGELLLFSEKGLKYFRSFQKFVPQFFPEVKPKKVFFSPTARWMGWWDGKKLVIWDKKENRPRLQAPLIQGDFQFLQGDSLVAIFGGKTWSLFHLYREQYLFQKEAKRRVFSASLSPCGTLLALLGKKKVWFFTLREKEWKFLFALKGEERILQLSFLRKSYGVLLLSPKRIYVYRFFPFPFRKSYLEVFFQKEGEALFQWACQARERGEKELAKKAFLKVLDYIPHHLEAREKLGEMALKEFQKEFVKIQQVFSRPLSLQNMERLKGQMEELLARPTYRYRELELQRESLQELKRALLACIKGEKYRQKKRWDLAYQFYAKASQFAPYVYWIKERERFLFEKINEKMTVASAPSKPKKTAWKTSSSLPSPKKEPSSFSPSKSQKERPSHVVSSKQKQANLKLRKEKKSPKVDGRAKTKKKKKKSSPKLLLKQADRYREKGKYKLARKFYQKLLSSPFREKAKLWLGWIAVKEKRWREALAFWRGVSLPFEFLPLYGRALEKVGEKEKALEVYEVVAKKQPGFWEKVALLAKKCGKAEKAYQAYLRLRGEKFLKQKVELVWTLRKKWPKRFLRLEEDLETLAEKDPYYVKKLMSFYRLVQREKEGGKKLVRFLGTSLPKGIRKELRSFLQRAGFVLWRGQWVLKEVLFERRGWKKKQNTWLSPLEYRIVQALEKSRKRELPKDIKQKYRLAKGLSKEQVIARLGFWDRLVKWQKEKEIYTLAVYEEKELFLFFQGEQLFWAEEGKLP